MARRISMKKVDLVTNLQGQGQLRRVLVVDGLFIAAEHKGDTDG
jgi:hypothetical protein